MLLKLYWKYENVCEVQRLCRLELATETPTRVTFGCIRHSFAVEGTVEVVQITPTSPASSVVVLQQLTWSPKNLSDDVLARQELAGEVYITFWKETEGKSTFEGCYMP
jgi:hypothetical protein